MKAKFLLIFMLITLWGCSDIETNDLIVSFDYVGTSNQITADGTSKHKLKVILNPNLDKKDLVITANSGVFNGETSISGKAEFIKDTLQLSVTFTAPISPQELIFFAELDIDGIAGKYKPELRINAIRSEPASITTNANSFSVPINFEGEVLISGKIYNQQGRNASYGTKVIMEDFDENFTPLEGVFRNENLSSNASGEISAIYTPGFVSENKRIALVTTVLDVEGVLTDIKDTVYLVTINNN